MLPFDVKIIGGKWFLPNFFLVLHITTSLEWALKLVLLGSIYIATHPAKKLCGNSHQ